MLCGKRIISMGCKHASLCKGCSGSDKNNEYRRCEDCGLEILRIESLYLDANGLLHSAAQLIFNYGSHKRYMDSYASLSNDQKILKVYELFFQMIYEVSLIIDPTKRLYIAIDGPAPMAKQAQQRQRRFIAAKEFKDSTKFNSACITPGTEFMFELTKYLHTHIRMRMNSDRRWSKLEVIFSPPTVPGEGEHKILEYIRGLSERERNEGHCMFGPDGDLIMLTLALHVPKIHLLREDQYAVGMYNLIDMGLIRRELTEVLGQSVGVKSKRRTFNDVTNDFILTGFFVGNDFLPKIQMFVFLEDGFKIMLKTYNILSQGGTTNHLTIDDEIDLEGYSLFVKEISKGERVCLLNQSERQVQQFYNDTLMRNVTDIPEGGKRLDFDKYRIEYYQKAGPNDEKIIRRMIVDYLKATIWVFRYYIKGLPCWGYYYPWHYAPLMEDLARVSNSLNEEEREFIYDFREDRPSLPFVQLLCVCPPSFNTLLPSEYRTLMIESPLVDSGIYPKTFDIDYEGKTAEYQGIAILPFVNRELVERVYRTVNIKRYTKNSVGRMEIFKYMSNYKSRYLSQYGNIANNRIKKWNVGPALISRRK